MLAIGMQLQMMPNRLRFLIGFRYKVQFDLDFKLAPTGFGNFKRRRFDGAEGVGVGFVELERDLLDEVGKVRVGVTGSDIDGPSVSVVSIYIGGTVGGIDWSGDGAEY